jgi:hypothetical protein
VNLGGTRVEGPTCPAETPVCCNTTGSDGDTDTDGDGDTDTDTDTDSDTDTDTDSDTDTDTDTDSDADTESMDPADYRLLLRDEGNPALVYIDVRNSENNWRVDIPKGRDIQLIGDDRVLVGTENGWEERDISTGAQVNAFTGQPGTVSARRLRNGNTMVIGCSQNDGSWPNGITMREIDGSGSVVNTISYSGRTYARLFRETPDGTFLVTSDTVLLELNASGSVVWQANVLNGVTDSTHAWMGVMVGTNRVFTCGYNQTLQIFNSSGTHQQSITGPSNVGPYFYSGFQVMPNGHYVVANWQDHSPNFKNGTQILEYDSSGNLVWSLAKLGDLFYSVQGIIVLNGLDTSKLHVEDQNGVLSPVD